jgi:hypothetical protein
MNVKIYNFLASIFLAAYYFNLRHNLKNCTSDIKKYFNVFGVLSIVSTIINAINLFKN